MLGRGLLGFGWLLGGGLSKGLLLLMLLLLLFRKGRMALLLLMLTPFMFVVNV